MLANPQCFNWTYQRALRMKKEGCLFISHPELSLLINHVVCSTTSHLESHLAVETSEKLRCFRVGKNITRLSKPEISRTFGKFWHLKGKMIRLKRVEGSSNGNQFIHFICTYRISKKENLFVLKFCLKMSSQFQKTDWAQKMPLCKYPSIPTL